ncbi:MAG: Gfo/Idh/MocA family oxidoreductase [Spirochaetes bacterium]|nr:Gfo/Idh/MocA family oxidoreductase [Spirochaetota bacterium]
MSKVTMAILGCGGMAGAHAGRFKNNPDVAITACCDVNEGVVNAFIDKNLAGYEPRPEVFTDPAAMYAKAKPTAVTIVTPHTMHFDHGMQALKAGCHVFMEKPMVTNAGQARELAAEVERTKKVFVIGYNTPCTPEFYHVRETIRNGTLGTLEMVTGYLSQGWKKATIGKWRQDPALSGGGQAYDSGAHLLNSLCWSVESDIDEVFAFIDNSGTPVDINSSINVKFSNGVVAAIAVSGNCPKADSFMTFIFDNGKIDINGWNGSWIKIAKGDKDVKYPAIDEKAQTPNDNFIDAVLGRAQARTSPRNGIIQSDLMDAIYESARTGKPARPKKR